MFWRSEEYHHRQLGDIVLVHSTLQIFLHEESLEADYYPVIYIYIYIYIYRAAACDVICLEAVVLPGGKTMGRLYGYGRKFTSFSLTSLALIIEHLQY